MLSIVTSKLSSFQSPPAPMATATATATALPPSDRPPLSNPPAPVATATASADARAAASARATASANAAGLCATRAKACSDTAASAKLRADKALAGLNKPSSHTAKKKALYFAEAAGASAEVAEAVAAVAAAASAEANAAAQEAEAAVAAGEFGCASEAAKAAASFASSSATASAAAANAAANAISAASDCLIHTMKAETGADLETTRGFLLGANSLFISIAAQNIVGKGWPSRSKTSQVTGYIFNQAVIGGCLAVQCILLCAKHQRTLKNCKILFFLVTFFMVLANSMMSTENLEQILLSFFAMVGFGVVLATLPTGLLLKFIVLVKSLFGYAKLR